MKFSRVVYTTVLSISLLVNLFLFLSQKKIRQEQENIKSSSIDLINQHPFLSKRIFAENQNDILINFIPLREAMRTYMDKLGEAAGVYFEYLPSGNSIGINDKMEV